MYIGHVGLALYAKSRRPRLPIALLVPAAFVPDWVQWTLYAFGITNPWLSHSIPAMLVCAIVVALAYRVLRADGEAADAWMLWALVLSHWPADFIAGVKPTWPGGPTVGLDLYRFGMPDFLVEFSLVLVCWMAYVASVPNATRHRAATWVGPVALALMQVAFLTLTTHLV